MSDIKQSFKEWALVELFGHARIAGLVTEANIGGGAFIRVDVPDANGETLFTRYFGPTAIYSLSPVARQTAIGLAQNIDAKPVKPFDIVKQIASGPIGLLDGNESEDE